MAMDAINNGEVIGQGAYRRVFRKGRSKYVFKVNISSCDSNSREISQYHAVKATLPKGVKMPEMILLENGVVAAEYIKGVFPEGGSFCAITYHDDDCDDNATCWAEPFIRTPGFSYYDVHRYNLIRTKDGTLYLIDVG
jgi:hypothetical protein